MYANLQPRLQAYLNGRFKYEPFDNERQKSDLMFTMKNTHWLVDKLDAFGLDVSAPGEPEPGDLPKTAMGASLTCGLYIFVLAMIVTSANKLFSGEYSLVPWAKIDINADKICKSLDGFEGSDSLAREDRPVPTDCAWDEAYTDWWSPEPPFLDVPALDFIWDQQIQFYEEDGKSSLAKIEWVDKNGLHFGQTSQDEDVPVAFGAWQTVPVNLDSYPEGGSDKESRFPNMTRTIHKMAGESATHTFDEALKFVYAKWEIFSSYDKFFDHDAAAFIRFDRKQLRNVKSCQLQFGLVNTLQYEALRHDLAKHNRMYQKKTLLNTLATDKWSWDVTKYTNTETGTWRRKLSMDNLMILKKEYLAGDVKTFMGSTAYGEKEINVERRLRNFHNIDTSAAVTNLDVGFTDWMVFASYVNNFQHSAENIICDGKEGELFDGAYVRAYAPTKTDTILTLKTPVVVWKSALPFYVTLTGDLGVERVLVKKILSTTSLEIVRGAVIGSLVLNHNITRPTSYPAVSDADLWVCPPNRYLDGKYCDCNCGMTDPDCLSGTNEVKYCNKIETCSPLGRCTRPIYDTVTGEAPEVAVSEPCHDLTLPGEVSLHGYIGHEDDFIADGGNTCEVCPHDEYYLGQANKDENNEYVCQYRPMGDVTSLEVKQLDSETFKLYGPNSTTTTNTYRIVKAHLGPKAGFPVFDALNKTNYTVELSSEFGTHELAQVIVAKPLESAHKTQELHLKAYGGTFGYAHFATGKVLSSMAGDYDDLIVVLDENSKTFSEVGPYRVQIDSSELIIRSASAVSKDSETTSTSSSSSVSSRRRLAAVEDYMNVNMEEELERFKEHQDAIAAEDARAGIQTRSRLVKDEARLQRDLAIDYAIANQFPMTAEEILEEKRFRFGGGSIIGGDERRLTDFTFAGDTAGDDTAAGSDSEERRRLSSTASTNTTTTTLNPTKKRQRLDVGTYPDGLLPAGVKGTLSRQYTANLEADASIYNYWRNDTRVTGSATEPARYLFFQDSNQNSIPGAENCFLDIYQTTDFTQSCSTTSDMYEISFKLTYPTALHDDGNQMAYGGANTAPPNPPVAPNAAFTLTAPINIAYNVGHSGTSIALSAWTEFKDAFYNGIMDGLGLNRNPVAPATQPDVNPTTDFIFEEINTLAECPTNFQTAPNADCNPMNPPPGTIGAMFFKIKFKVRPWYSTKKQIEQLAAAATAAGDSWPTYQTLQSAITTNLVAVNNYQLNSQGQQVPYVTGGSFGFTASHVSGGYNVAGFKKVGSRRLEETGDMMLDKLDNLDAEDTASAAARRELSSGSGAPPKRYDLTIETQLKLDTISTTADAIRNDAAFKTAVKTSFVHVLNQPPQPVTPTLTNADVTEVSVFVDGHAFGKVAKSNAWEAQNAPPPGHDHRLLSAAPVFRLEIIMKSLLQGDQVQKAMDQAMKPGNPFNGAFITKLKTEYTAITAADFHVSTSDKIENLNQRPTADYSTLTPIVADKPWCDYSTLYGKPGTNDQGVTYTSGRDSIFCDGLHDGLIVVNAAGFSDPSKVPQNSDVRVLIRGSSNEPKKTTPMEVRKIQKAYQWLFPKIDATTGQIGQNQVNEWICKPEKFGDGNCDCNCGRPDVDCFGDLGSPEYYVTDTLENPTSTVTTNVNCPQGTSKLVQVPELASTGGLPPTCGELLLNSKAYPYCDFTTGLPTAVRENHFIGTYADGTAFNGTGAVAVASFMKYLWEVVELDRSLSTNRDVGTIVETLGVSQKTAASYKSSNKPSYVDTDAMATGHDDFAKHKPKDTACFGANPPAHCATARRLHEKRQARQLAATEKLSGTKGADGDTSIAAESSGPVGDSERILQVDQDLKQANPELQAEYWSKLVSKYPWISSDNTNIANQVTGRKKQPSASTVAEILQKKFYTDDDYHSFLEASGVVMDDAAKRDLLEEADFEHTKPSERAKENRIAKRDYYGKVGNDPRKGVVLDKSHKRHLTAVDCKNPDWTNASAVAAACDNLRVEDIPESALSQLSHDELEAIGFFDNVKSAIVATKVGPSADSAASAIKYLPDKKVISQEIQAIASINLYRDKNEKYLPKNRWMSTVHEKYDSQSILDVDLGMFVMPKRKLLADLCPNKWKKGQKISNSFARKSVSGIEGFDKWSFMQEDNFNTTCTVTPFTDDDSKCKDKASISSVSKDKYRLYCIKDMMPANTMDIRIKGALTGHWLFPEARETGFNYRKPEFFVDLEATYHFTLDQAFLDVEKSYMKGAMDYHNGNRRLWAAETMARGKARCNSTVIDACVEGVPANPPSMLPSIIIKTNRERTNQMLEDIGPENWPEDDDAREALYDDMDSQAVELTDGLRRLASAEDGYIALKPMMKTNIKVVWSISPVYKLDLWGTTYTLDRWISNVKSLDVSFGNVDYSMRSKAKVRMAFQIDHGSFRFQENPTLTVNDLYVSVGAWMGYIGIFGALLVTWQKWTRPFGYVSGGECDDCADEINKGKPLAKINKIRKLMGKKPITQEEFDGEIDGEGGEAKAKEGDGKAAGSAANAAASRTNTDEKPAAANGNGVGISAKEAFGDTAGSPDAVKMTAIIVKDNDDKKSDKEMKEVDEEKEQETKEEMQCKKEDKEEKNEMQEDMLAHDV